MTEPLRTLLLPHPHARRHKLGRHVEHDPKSRAYLAPAAPQIRTVRHKRVVPIFDQGSLGSCTANAGVGCISTAPFSHQGNEAEAVTIYSAATETDSFPGSYPPNDTGSSGLAVANVLKSRKLITGFAHTFDLDRFLRALTLGPGFVGIAWLAGCDAPAGPHGLVSYSGKLEGGHEICASGLDAENKIVIFDNSWGAGWGAAGSFAMTFDDVAKALADSGDAIFPTLPAKKDGEEEPDTEPQIPSGT